jgi:hypothetical protein
VHILGHPLPGYAVVNSLPSATVSQSPRLLVRPVARIAHMF